MYFHPDRHFSQIVRQGVVLAENVIKVAEKAESIGSRFGWIYIACSRGRDYIKAH